MLADGSRPGATASGLSVSQRNATRAFDAAGKRATFDSVTFHALRHTFASMLIGRGEDPVFVADQLGHSKPAFTLNTYAHLFRAARHAREARKQLEAEYGDLLRGASKGASNS
jgi:integrase